MKLKDIKIKYAAFVIIDEDGHVYLCKPGWPEIVEINMSKRGESCQMKPKK